MMRCVLAACLAIGLATIAPAGPPLTFTERVEIQGYRFPVFIEVYLEPASRTKIAVKVAGNIRSIQVNLPGLLSDVVQDRCDQKITLVVDQALAEGDHIRLHGRVQIIRFRCNEAEDFESRRRVFSNTTEVNALLDGRIVDNCLRARLEELTISPSGLAGGIMNLFNLTERVSDRVRLDLNDTLNARETCLDIPAPLQTLDAHIRSGGFRDFGNGHLGFVIQGSIDLNANGVIAILEQLPEMGGDCDCD